MPGERHSRLLCDSGNCTKLSFTALATEENVTELVVHREISFFEKVFSTFLEALFRVETQVTFICQHTR